MIDEGEEVSFVLETAEILLHQISAVDFTQIFGWCLKMSARLMWTIHVVNDEYVSSPQCWLSW